MILFLFILCTYSLNNQLLIFFPLKSHLDKFNSFNHGKLVIWPFMCQLIVKDRHENSHLPKTRVFVSAVCLTGVLRSVAQLWPPWAHFSDRHLSLCREPSAVIDYWPPQQSHRCTQLRSSARTLSLLPATTEQQQGERVGRMNEKWLL